MAKNLEDIVEQVCEIEQDVKSIREIMHFGEPGALSSRSLTEVYNNLNSRVLKLNERVDYLTNLDKQSRSKITYLLIILLLTQLVKLGTSTFDMEYVKYLIGF